MSECLGICLCFFAPTQIMFHVVHSKQPLDGQSTTSSLIPPRWWCCHQWISHHHPHSIRRQANLTTWNPTSSLLQTTVRRRPTLGVCGSLVAAVHMLLLLFLFFSCVCWCVGLGERVNCGFEDPVMKKNLELELYCAFYRGLFLQERKTTFLLSVMFLDEKACSYHLSAVNHCWSATEW